MGLHITVMLYYIRENKKYEKNYYCIDIIGYDFQYICT